MTGKHTHHYSATLHQYITILRPLPYHTVPKHDHFMPDQTTTDHRGDLAEVPHESQVTIVMFISSQRNHNL